MAQITQAELADKYGLTRAQIGQILIKKNVKCVGMTRGKNTLDKATHTKLYEERDARSEEDRDAALAIIAMYNDRKRDYMQKAADEGKNAARIAEIFRGGREPKP